MKDAEDKPFKPGKDIRRRVWDIIDEQTAGLPPQLVPGKEKRMRDSEHRKMEVSADNEGKKRFFARFKDVLVRKVERFKTGLRIHSAVFGSVNGFLFALNMLTSASFPWFLFPLGAWGMGLFIHFGAWRMLKRRKDEFDRFDYLTPEQMKTLEQYINSKTGIGMHAYASAAVVGYLALVNIITGMGFPWFLIVAASLGVPLAIHGAVQAAIQTSLREKLKRLLHGVPRKASVGYDADGSEEYLRAVNLRAKIIKTLEKGTQEQQAMVPEMMKVLDHYTEAIRVLAGQSEKYGLLLESFDPDSFTEEKEKIGKRLETVSTEGLRKEYQQALGHIEKQARSYTVLAEKEELIRMRIKSTLSAMEKMNMDLVMMEDVSTHMFVLKDARKKAEELEQYSRDLEEGYRALEEEL
ncbi:MAG: 2TM domain-containing protein [Spirochaetales bacterium]|nr:2TM domain-containing protein [Spirochaetales bacterium]